MRMVNKTREILSSCLDDILLVILTEVAMRLLATVDFVVLEISAWRLEPTATLSSRLMGSSVEDNYYTQVIKMIILMTRSLIRDN